MERHKEQLELFSEAQDNNDARNAQKNSPYFFRIWNYEKTILLIITLLVTGIVSFSMGVEKGKKIALAPQGALTALTKNNGNQLVSSPIVVKNAPLSRKPVALKINGYTIQVASFNNKSYALKEAEFLKKKGLVPLLFSNGNYIILCVGNFPNKEKAQPLLSELNKRYPNCSIRRL